MKVLFVAYFFPPAGGAGTQRPVQFCRHLPAFGFEPVVVTAPAPRGDRWSPVDASMGDLLPSGLRIERVTGAEPQVGPWVRRMHRWAGSEAHTPFACWWRRGVIEAGKRGGGGVDVVLATMGPFESARPAARLASELGVPWVADLRDPWALDEMQVYLTGLHRRRQLREMRRALSSAAAIIANTPEAALAISELMDTRVVSIPNGFDRDDFSGAAPAREPGPFRVVHTGYLHTELGRRHRRTTLVRRVLGGMIAPVDIFTRSHVFLLEAIDRVREREPELARPLELHLAGVMSDSDLEVAGAEYVRLYGYVTHSAAVALMRTADLLFLPMHNLPPGRRSRIVPGKTYEYLASERPLLAAVPDGDARDLLESAPETTVCRPDDVAGMSEALISALRRHRQGPVPHAARPNLERYERRNLTRELAELLSGAVGARGTPVASRVRDGG